MTTGAEEGSTDPNDYEFGLEAKDISEYCPLADPLYASFTAVWSPDRLTSYLDKLIDYVPTLLKQGDIPSLMRFEVQQPNVN